MGEWSFPEDQKVRKWIDEGDLQESDGDNTSKILEVEGDENTYFIKIRPLYGEANRQDQSLEEMEQIVEQNIVHIEEVGKKIKPLPSSVVRGEDYVAVCQPKGEPPTRDDAKQIAHYFLNSVQGGYKPDLGADIFRTWNGEIWQSDVNDQESFQRNPDFEIEDLVNFYDARNGYKLHEVMRDFPENNKAITEKVIEYELKASQYIPEEFGLSDSCESV